MKADSGLLPNCWRPSVDWVILKSNCLLGAFAKVSENEYTVDALHARIVFLKTWHNSKLDSSRLIFPFELFCSRWGAFSDVTNMQPLQCIFAFNP